MARNGVRVVTIGHILQETIRFPDRELGPVLGGPVAYSAVAAARSGASCGIVSVASPDVGSTLLKPLVEARVDLAGLARRGETRTSVLSYERSGNKRIDYTRVADKILAQDVPETYLDADGFLLCPLDFEVSDELVERVGSTSGVRMADLGGWGGVVSTQHPVDDPRVATRVRDLVNAVDVVKASTEDCAYVVGRTEPFRAARALTRLGARVALVTCGAFGLVLDDGRDRAWVPAFAVEAVDATGAGDVFCGAFLTEVVRSGDLRVAAEYGSAAAALVVTGTGGVSTTRIPDYLQVTALVRQGSRVGPDRSMAGRDV